jgi:protein-S-isoprenylcysteine O-methyltransferase Ste14
MKYILLTLILLFYIFFFSRALLLSKKLGKNIKSNGILVNSSILTAGLSTVIFILFLFIPDINKYAFIFFSHELLLLTGAVFICAGLIFSTLASLSLKNSWRIGVDEKEKTELIESGMYRFSRNPYFLSYDIVLIGMAICFPSPLMIAPVLITIILFHMMILKEEKHLEINHTAYIKYKNKVRRYL